MKKLRGRKTLGSLIAGIVCLVAGALAGSVPALAENQNSAPGTATTAAAQATAPQPSGIISGTVVDRTGAAVAGARIELKRAGQSATEETAADSDGQFFFANVLPGSFELTVTAQGFAAQMFSGVLHEGESYTVPPITLPIASVVTEVRVTPEEEAKAELAAQEKQRVLGVIPNFYVSYVPDAAPLAPKQKFQLAWKTLIDPVTFLLTGAAAGIEQAGDYPSGYGQGAEGFAKRYGASYADGAIGTFITSAILPSLLKQDPRYFYKGTGSKTSRFLYAFGNTFFCKGDKGNWQANYSNILGSLASGGIANLYYPANERGVAETFENALIGIGTTGAANVLQEFVIPKLTPNLHLGSHKPDPGF